MKERMVLHDHAAGADGSRSSSTGAGASQTDWSMIHAAGGPDRDSNALDRVARRYWPAIFAFVRSSGRDVHAAADLTQGFICDVVLGRDLLGRADPRRGRFRVLLATALRNYLREDHRRGTRRKRRPADGAGLDLDPQVLDRVAPPQGASPQEAFDRQWSVTLVHRVLDRVRAGCLDDGLDVHWAVFEQRVARPLLTGAPPTPYATLVAQHELADAGQAANHLVTIKRRFVRALDEEIRSTLGPGEDVEEEILTLLGALEGRP